MRLGGRLLQYDCREIETSITDRMALLLRGMIIAVFLLNLVNMVHSDEKEQSTQPTKGLKDGDVLSFESQFPNRIPLSSLLDPVSEDGFEEDFYMKKKLYVKASNARKGDKKSLLQKIWSMSMVEEYLWSQKTKVEFGGNLELAKVSHVQTSVKRNSNALHHARLTPLLYFCL